jgi:hypothetical protein
MSVVETLVKIMTVTAHAQNAVRLIRAFAIA